MSRRGRILALLAGVLLLAGGLAWLARDAVKRGAAAYLYAYPLVIMDVNRAYDAVTLGPENVLQRVRVFPDAGFKGVVRPNADTLYTVAWLDMDAGPFVFEMPANDARYSVMSFLDAWTNVFAAPGTRTSGTAAQAWLLAGPRWQGEVPAGLVLMRAPTRMVRLIGRLQTNGAEDYPVVHALQDALQLRTLAAWLSGQAPAPPAWQRGAEPLPPVEQMRAMSMPALMAHFARLQADNPPVPDDPAMAAILARMGIRPGAVPDWSFFDGLCYAAGRKLAEAGIARAMAKPQGLLEGWFMPPPELGNFGKAYELRAAVATIGLGANLAADAIYPSARVDAQGRVLNGAHRYRIHFAPGRLPPVRAFWSVTAYGMDDFFIENPARRYAIGDRDPLVRNADGSLDLLVQADAPEGPRKANWLPVKSGEDFQLNARLYWPAPEALDGRWRMPGVERMD